MKCRCCHKPLSRKDDFYNLRCWFCTRECYAGAPCRKVEIDYQVRLWEAIQREREHTCNILSEELDRLQVAEQTLTAWEAEANHAL